MNERLRDNKNDRDIGTRWERNFCETAAKLGFMFTALQIGRIDSAAAWTWEKSTWNICTLPDVTVWTSPAQHHEIKHKNPTRRGCFGLEVYRFEKLMRFMNESKQDVYYTIHNWDAAPGGRDGEQNRIQDWIVSNVDTLKKAIDNGKAELNRACPSYVNGVMRSNIPIYFWPKDLWIPLSELWSTALLASL